MFERIAAVALVLAAALADQLGAHTLAFDALLVAVPLTAIAGLRAVSDRLEGKAPSQAYVWALVLALLLTATAVRAPTVGDPAVPAVARSALLACIAVFCLQAVAAIGRELRSRPPE